MMRKSVFTIALLLCLGSLLFCRGQENAFREKQVIDSRVLEEKREILVSLPKNYQKERPQCMVLIVLDANFHFKYVSSLVQFYTRLEMVPPTIVVGVPPIRRFDELSFNNVQSSPAPKIE